MPPVNKYRCNHCGLSFPDGWGGYFYVEVDEEFLNKRLNELQAKLNSYREILHNINRYIFELRERLLQDFKDFVSRVQEIIQHIQAVEDREYGTRILESLIKKLLSIKSVDELRAELNRVERQSEEIIKDFPLMRLLLDMQRYVEDRMHEAESLVNELNDIRKRLELSGKKSIRIPCPHPQEHEYASRILGVPPGHPLFKQRTGFNSYAICLDCLHQFEADFRDEKVNEWRFWYGYPTLREAFRGKPQMKDERKCPRCGSTNVKTVFELVGKPCPRCKIGVIEEIETGIMA
jgi:hypothetical protein